MPLCQQFVKKERNKLKVTKNAIGTHKTNLTPPLYIEVPCAKPGR